MSFKCIICEESLAFLFPGEAARNIVSTSCGHVFHSVCIRKWIQLKTRQYYRFAEPTDRFALHCPYTCPNISKSSFNPLLLEDANDNDSTFRIRHIPVLLNQGSPKLPSPAPALTCPRSSSTFTVAAYSQQESDEDENSINEEELPSDSTPSPPPSPTSRQREDQNIIGSSDRNEDLPNQLVEVGVPINDSNESEALFPNNTSSDSGSISLSAMLTSFLQIVEAQEELDLDENANNVGPKASPAAVSKPALDLPFPNEFTVVLERNIETWKVGDFVIWSYGDENIGRLRWIGKFRSQPYAGVEFDAPIGNYMRRNEEFPDIKCKAGHGRLVRVSDLQLLIPSDDQD